MNVLPLLIALGVLCVAGAFTMAAGAIAEIDAIVYPAATVTFGTALAIIAIFVTAIAMTGFSV